MPLPDKSVLYFVVRFETDDPDLQGPDAGDYLQSAIDVGHGGVDDGEGTTRIAVLPGHAEERGDGWNPATAPPDTRRQVLYYPDQGDVSIGFFDGGTWWDGARAEEVEPTHWKEKPSRPRGV